MSAGPLAGKRILITRAHAQAAEMRVQLEKLGAEVIAIPTIEIHPPQSFNPLDRTLQRIQSYDWLIVTSVNGVKSIEKRMQALGISSTFLRGIKIAAIGPASRDAMEKLGAKVAVTPNQYVAEGIVAALRERVAGKKIALVRAKVARDVIPDELRAAGATVDVVDAYETHTPKNSRARFAALFSAGKPQVITFTSSSTVKGFAALIPQGTSPKEWLSGVAVASIGPVTSQTLCEAGIQVDIEAREYSIPGLIEAIVEWAK